MMEYGEKGVAIGRMPLAEAVDLCLGAKQENRLYPKDAYDSVYSHASDRDLTPELLLCQAAQSKFSDSEQLAIKQEQ